MKLNLSYLYECFLDFLFRLSDMICIDSQSKIDELHLFDDYFPRNDKEIGLLIG